ncbi:MAG: Zn-dependent hydrolase [Alphaproteobacteria bacterium]|nr:Zn-dependent hydrolase [Alphaproteobacteria bacterium]
MSEPRNLSIDGDRLWDSLMEMAKIGPGVAGGNRRLALTDEDKEGRDLFVSWCEAAGCTVSVDAMGNIFARRAGRDDSLAPVVTGSHLDTQPTGGKYDGVYGVLVGLEVIRSLNDLGYRTERPIEVVCWTNEEGSRFAPAMISSGVYAGAFTLEEALAKVDADGATLGGELERIGYAGDLPVGGREFHAYLEAHIEQGPILEDEGKDIGIVTGAQGQRWYEITLTGQESHAGTTPMERRRDALLGAARIVELVNRIGLDNGPDGRATVGLIESHPNSRNVIPGRVFMTSEFRHPDDDTLAAMDAGYREGVEAIAADIGLELAFEQIFHIEVIDFDERCVAAVRNAAEERGLAAREIISGAGHDACNIAAVAPASMIFIPCVDGISHNEAEEITPAWSTAGGQVLLGALLELAGGE